MLAKALHEMPERRAPIVAHKPLQSARPSKLRIGQLFRPCHWQQHIVANVVHVPLANETLKMIEEFQELVHAD